MALVLILWILVILTITALGFAFYIRLQLKITKNQTERLKAYYIAKAGIDRAILELKRDTNDYDALNEKWSTNEEVYKNIPFAQGKYNIQVTDEESKLNINLPLKLLLLSLPEIKEDQISAILEYRKKKGIFKSADKIFTLKEMDQETFSAIRDFITVYSFEKRDKTKINLNKATRGELKSKLNLTYKEADDIIKHRPYQHLTDLLELDRMNKTRFIQLIDRITASEAEIIPGRININTAGEEILRALGFGPATAESIIEQRKENPFKSLSGVLSLPGIDLKGLKQLNLDLMTTRSHAFAIYSTATLKGTIIRIKAVVRRDTTPTDGRPKISILYWKELS